MQKLRIMKQEHEIVTAAQILLSNYVPHGSMRQLYFKLAGKSTLENYVSTDEELAGFRDKQVGL